MKRIFYFYLFTPLVIFASNGSYENNYRECAEALCGEALKNPMTSILGNTKLEASLERDFENFRPQIIDFLNQNKKTKIQNIKSSISNLRSNDLDSKFLKEFINMIPDQVRVNTSRPFEGLSKARLILPTYLQAAKENLPILFEQLEDKILFLNDQTFEQLLRKEVLSINDIKQFMGNKIDSSKSILENSKKQQLATLKKEFPEINNDGDLDNYLAQLKIKFDEHQNNNIAIRKLLRLSRILDDFETWKDKYKEKKDKLSKVEDILSRNYELPQDVDAITLAFRELRLFVDSYNPDRSEELCHNDTCRKEILSWLAKKNIPEKLKRANQKIQEFTDFEDLASQCKGYWLKDSFFNGKKELLKNYVENIDEGKNKFDIFAKELGVSSDIPIHFEIEPSRNNSLDKFREKVLNQKEGFGFFAKNLSLMSLLEWSFYNEDYDPKRGALHDLECTEEDFTATSFTDGKNLVISRRDAIISNMQGSYGIYFHEAGHILEQFINSNYESASRPCAYVHLEDKANSLFSDLEDREQYFSETIADIISILLDQNNENLIYCRMLSLNDDRRYKVEPLLPDDVHLGAMSRILLEAKMKGKNIPQSCKEVINKNKKIVFE